MTGVEVKVTVFIPHGEVVEVKLEGFGVDAMKLAQRAAAKALAAVERA